MNELRRATATDVAAIADLWNVGMRDEPMAQWPLDCGQPELAAVTEFAVLAENYVKVDAVWVDSELNGAAAWLSPEASDEFSSVDALVRRAVTPFTDDGGARYEMFWQWIADRMPDEPMWFLDIVAVRESARGLGIGSALIRYGLECAARDRLPAILETGSEANVAYYERFGFAVTEVAQAPSGGPTVWFMVAQPQS